MAADLDEREISVLASVAYRCGAENSFTAQVVRYRLLLNYFLYLAIIVIRIRWITMELQAA